ncbi:MAG: DEAD/DEAH box helicase [Bacteroidetes bacterium]|nr:DEAD/DEAH box helicase [Bacteroidota bacterium]
MKFSEFNLDPKLMEGLSSMGFETPTPIQEQTIPIITAGKDLIACAQTGTGKTAAFLLPILSKLSIHPSDHVDTLIISPTRELAQQTDRALQGFAYFTSVSSIAIYGGNDGGSFEQEKVAVTEGANIVVATPGRLMSHLNMGYVKFDKIRHLILDEADRMLDMGFYDDIMKIVKHLPQKKQTLLFSATMPPRIREMAKKILHHPVQINIAIAKPAEGILQTAYLTYDNQKNDLIVNLLKGKMLQSILVFSATKSNVKILERDLYKLGLSVKAIHSDLEQKEREEVLRDFTSRKTRVLVATDILSRGIDIEGIDLVINYDVPRDAEDYVHRIGRTARAQSTGVAITLINEKDQRSFKRIEDFIGNTILKSPLPESMGKGPAYEPMKRHVMARHGRTSKEKQNR